jgi:O-succinylhomoserine sulfhydrylase
VLSNNLGDANSIAPPPATPTPQRRRDAQKDDLGITPGLIRFSVGLEDTDDLIADLLQALEISQS